LTKSLAILIEQLYKLEILILRLKYVSVVTDANLSPVIPYKKKEYLLHNLLHSIILSNKQSHIFKKDQINLPWTHRNFYPL